MCISWLGQSIEHMSVSLVNGLSLKPLLVEEKVVR